MDDTVTVRRNITVLTAAQALGGSSAPIVMSLGGLVGQQLADNPAWVTLPVSLFGVGLLPLVADGGWYQPLRLMLLAPSAFIILGLLVWAVRSLRRGQREAPEFELREQQRTTET